MIKINFLKLLCVYTLIFYTIQPFVFSKNVITSGMLSPQSYLSSLSKYVKKNRNFQVNSMTSTFIVHTINDSTFPYVYKILNEKALQYNESILESLKFIKETCNGIIAPFTIIEDAELNDKKFPFIIVQKKLKILSFEDFEQGTYVLENGQSVNIKNKIKEIVLALFERGLFFQDHLEIDNFGIDEETGDFYLIDFGTYVPERGFIAEKKRNEVMQINSQGEIIRKLSGFQGSSAPLDSYIVGHTREYFDEIGMPSESDLYKLWGTKKSDMLPVSDVELINPEQVFDEKLPETVENNDTPYPRDDLLVQYKLQQYWRMLTDKKTDIKKLNEIAKFLERIDDYAEFIGFTLSAFDAHGTEMNYLSFAQYYLPSEDYQTLSNLEIHQLCDHSV